MNNVPMSNNIQIPPRPPPVKKTRCCMKIRPKEAISYIQ